MCSKIQKNKNYTASPETRRKRRREKSETCRRYIFRVVFNWVRKKDVKTLSRSSVTYGTALLGKVCWAIWLKHVEEGTLKCRSGSHRSLRWFSDICMPGKHQKLDINSNRFCPLVSVFCENCLWDWRNHRAQERKIKSAALNLNINLETLRLLELPYSAILAEVFNFINQVLLLGNSQLRTRDLCAFNYGLEMPAQH